MTLTIMLFVAPIFSDTHSGKLSLVDNSLSKWVATRIIVCRLFFNVCPSCSARSGSFFTNPVLLILPCPGTRIISSSSNVASETFFGCLAISLRTSSLVLPYFFLNSISDKPSLVAFKSIARSLTLPSIMLLAYGPFFFAVPDITLPTGLSPLTFALSRVCDINGVATVEIDPEVVDVSEICLIRMEVS